LVGRINRQSIQSAADAARKASPEREDRGLAALQKSKVGPPVMVYTPAGGPSYWLVPFIIGDLVCGFANVDLNNQVTQISALGGGPGDRQSWIPLSFFEHPPERFLSEIRDKYAGLKISEPLFSYDSSPAKWAWRLEVGSLPTPVSVAFITFTGWYERRQGPSPSDREG
jgi:hypothetical protein